MENQTPDQSRDRSSDLWLAVLQGNTHHRWGWFEGDHLCQVEIFLTHEVPAFPDRTEIWIARVGADPQMPIDPSRSHLLNLSQIPLSNLYSTLGIDRALALIAAGQLIGWPSLVIDAGTALTLTGGDEDQQLIGGAILPGLTLQLRSLHEHTVTLPQLSWHGLNGELPRWALDTPTAIYSGIRHTVIAGLRSYCDDWLGSFPDSCIVITGGDGVLIADWLRQDPKLEPLVRLEPDLVLLGISWIRNRNLCFSPC